MKWIFALALAFFAGVHATAMPVTGVPDPMRSRGRHVGDNASVLSDAYVEMIDNVARQLHAVTGAELAVITVDSLDGDSVEKYANILFSRLGLGRKGKDDGLLILFARDDRRARIETGYGLEHILPDALCGRLLDRHALPEFKEKRYGKGLFLLSAAVAGLIAEANEVVLTVDQPVNWPEEALVSESFRTRISVEKIPAAAMLVLLIFAVSGLRVAWLLARFSSSRSRSGRQLFADEIGDAALWALITGCVGSILIWVLAGSPIPGIIASAPSIAIIYQASLKLGKKIKKSANRYKAPCPACATLMRRLVKNKNLTEEENAEERAGGMSYEIWVCDACKNSVRVDVRLKGASRCPACRRRTLQKSENIIELATKDAKGKKELEQKCLNPGCEYHKTLIRSIPRRGSVFMSIGSSAGGSWGGGSSGGGGGSRGW